MVNQLNFKTASLALAFLLTFAGLTFSQSKSAVSTVNHQRKLIDATHLQTIAFCDLVNYPQRYDGKVVRTQAIYVVTSETEIFYDPVCVRKDTWTQYKSGNKEAFTALSDYIGESRSSQARRAKVTVIGRFEGPNRKGYGHLNFAKFRFVVMRVENIEPVAPNIPYPWQIKK